MFVSTYSSIESQFNLKSQCIGIYNTEIDAIKGTLQFLILEQCIWINLIDELIDYISMIEIELLDNGYTIDELCNKMDIELYNWFKLHSTQQKVKCNEKEVIAFEFSSIISKHIKTIEEAYKYIEQHQNTYLRIDWAFSIEKIDN